MNSQNPRIQFCRRRNISEVDAFYYCRRTTRPIAKFIKRYSSIFLLFFYCSISAAQNLNSQAKLIELNYSQLDSLMHIEYKNGDYRKAMYFMQIGRVKSKAQFGAQDSIYAGYTGNLGFFYKLTGQYHKAEPLYLEAKNIYGKVLGKDNPRYATSLNNLAVLYKYMGSYAQAEPLYLEAKNIQAKVLGKQDPSYARSLNNLASLYQEMGSYAQAEPLYLEAKNIYAKVLGKENHYYATSVHNLAGLYQVMNRYGQAEAFYQEAKNIYAKVLGKGHRYYASSLHNLAALYQNLGSYKQAEPLLLEAKSIRLTALGNEHPEFATSLNNLAALYQNMGSYEKAEPLLLEAQKIRAKVLGKEHPRYARILNDLALLYNKMGRLDSAYFCCMASIDANSAQIDSNLLDVENLDKFDFYSNQEINRSINTLLIIIKAQFNNESVSSGQKKDSKNAQVTNQSSGQTAQSKIKQHYKLTQAAMRLNERIRNNFSNEGDKLRILKANSHMVLQGIETAVLLEKEIYKKDAFSFAEQNKSILLADAVKGNRARALGDLPDSLVKKEILFQKKITELKKEQFKAKSAEQKNKINQSLGELNLEINAFLKSLKDKYPKYHALKYENITAKADGIQALLDENTLLIEYFQSDSMLYLFVLGKDKVELFPLKLSKRLLKAKIYDLRRVLSNYAFISSNESEAYELYTKIAHWFYKEILEIGIKGKTIQNLIIIADGELGYLPFEAFLMEAAPKIEYSQNKKHKNREYNFLKYLVNDYNISYNYSATLWKENLGSTHDYSQGNNGQILACAASYPKVDSSLLNIRLPYFFNLRRQLIPLPATRLEITALEENFKGDFLLDEQSNEKFFKENAQKYGVIHLAMHGILDTRIPILSSFAFTENKDSLEDNFLQAFEISRLKLNADLVVLSACETAYGKFEQGEGVISLARSFMYAGVPSLMVSLWQVNDNSTAIIMKSFYQNLANRMDKASALRQAKLSYVKEAVGINAHPAFWSPFIQLGDSRPIDLATKGNSLLWAVGGGGFLLFILCGMAFKKARRSP